MFLKSRRSNPTRLPLPCEEYRRLEGFDLAGCDEGAVAKTKHSVGWGARLRSAIAAWIDRLSAAPEVCVREKRDRFGNVYWYAYDPKSGTSYTTASDADLMAWIESRYSL